MPGARGPGSGATTEDGARGQARAARIASEEDAADQLSACVEAGDALAAGPEHGPVRVDTQTAVGERDPAGDREALERWRVEGLRPVRLVELQADRRLAVEDRRIEGDRVVDRVVEGGNSASRGGFESIPSRRPSSPLRVSSDDDAVPRRSGTRRRAAGRPWRRRAARRSGPAARARPSRTGRRCSYGSSGPRRRSAAPSALTMIPRK